MHLSPLESIFNHLFYGVMDVLFFILNILAVLIIRGTPWRVHLRWLVPFVIASGLQIINRTILNTHFLFGLSIPDGLYIFGRTCNYISDVIALYGTVILVQTLRQIVNGTMPELPDDISQRASEEMVWPPPPAKKIG